MASDYYDSSGKVVYDGDVAQASDLNTINTAVDSAFQLVESDFDDLSGDAKDWADKAEAWATTVEDTEVETGKYSSLHYAAKALASRNEASASEISAANSKNSAQSYSNASFGYSLNASNAASNSSTYATNSSNSANAAATSASNASTSEGNASTYATNSSNSANAASGYKDDAETAQTAAESAQTSAETARDKAEDWAEEDHNVEVETGKYSAKHWATEAEDTLAEYIKKDGSVAMTSDLTLANSTPSNTLYATSKGYVDGKFTSKVSGATSGNFASLDSGGDLTDSNYSATDITNKAPLASPSLTGSPTAPTQITTDNTTKIATTAFVRNTLDDYSMPTASTDTSTTVSSGNTWNPPSGWYMFTDIGGTTTIDFEVFSNGSWRVLGAITTTKTFGAVWCDGTNMRVVAGGSDITIYYRKLN